MDEWSRSSTAKGVVIAERLKRPQGRLRQNLLDSCESQWSKCCPTKRKQSSTQGRLSTRPSAPRFQSTGISLARIQVVKSIQPCIHFYS